jgi:hypothetical protein
MKKTLLLSVLLCLASFAFAGTTYTQSSQNGTITKTSTLDTATRALTNTTCVQTAHDVQKSQCVSETTHLDKKQAALAKIAFQTASINLQSKAAQALALRDAPKGLNDTAEPLSRSMATIGTKQKSSTVTGPSSLSSSISSSLSSS